MESNGKPKILIVDDERGLRLGTKRLLEREGYNVSLAENGTEGIRFGTSEEFDLAIIDLRMPDIDGLQVLKEIKAKYPGTICFIATAYASYDTAIESTKLGAYTYIPKPFTPEELLQNLEQGYEKRKLHLETERLRKEREERLLEVAFEKTRLNTIINSITDGVLVVNKKGETVLYNPAVLLFLKLDNIKIEENILEKIHPEIAGLINKILLAGEFEKKTYTSQVEVNQDLFIEATSSPVPHPDGTLAGVVVVMKNITELKKVESLKSQFVSMVSHELKAPIAAVYGFMNLLLDNSMNLSEEQRKNYLVRSQVRLDGLIKMVNDLLDISKMEMKTSHKEIKDLDIELIINSVVDLLAFEIKKKKISLQVNTENNLKSLKADSDEMLRLFTNLISNAIKYNKEDGSIKISIKNIENYLVISVEDTGIGLKQEEKERLFSEFFRAKNEFTKNISGTGLGLSIVKRIVDSYAGKIEVKSEFGKGTEIKVYLPVY